jgi:5'-deoxynucleotidase YfbR-like HD superfamily hydrolase
MKDAELLEFFHDVGKLKSLKRSGWLRTDISNPESVAEHSFRTAVMAMVLGDILELDTNKLLKMALLHDMPEILTGDITPLDEMNEDEKRKGESKAVKEILKDIPNADEYIALWYEFEKQQSPEAKLIKNLDKLEMALQAAEYYEEFSHWELFAFIRDAENRIDIPEVRNLFEKIRQEFTKD